MAGSVDSLSGQTDTARLQACMFACACNNFVSVAIETIIQLTYPKRLYDFGARGSVVVKALCCKPEGREFETQ
jgi:hypothetical protein